MWDLLIIDWGNNCDLRFESDFADRGVGVTSKFKIEVLVHSAKYLMK